MRSMFFICLLGVMSIASSQTDSMYKALAHPDLSQPAYVAAIQAYKHFYDSFVVKDTITIIDFSQHSSKARFFVINLRENQVLFSTITTHGANSGLEIATSFSNTINSFKSSLGCFKTAEYDISDSHDTVLILDGLEKGINHNARVREIVIHRSEMAKTVPYQYCSQEFIDSMGFNGQSFGCPVLPRHLYKPIMKTIAGGSMLFVYAPSDYYRRHSGIKF